MSELKQINATIHKKQIGRIVSGLLSVTSGLVLISSFMYQKGITDCQKHISDTFPDLYEEMTTRVTEAFEKN